MEALIFENNTLQLPEYLKHEKRYVLTLPHKKQVICGTSIRNLLKPSKTPYYVENGLVSIRIFGRQEKLYKLVDSKGDPVLFKL